MSRRLSIVDLTSANSSSVRRPSNSSSNDRSRNPGVYQIPMTNTHRGVKRRREEDGFWSSGSLQGDGQDEEPIESIDLTEPEGSLAKTLAKQREDAIKAQQSTEEAKGRSLLNSYKCPVCMDTPEDATSTSCGHLFCHRCIIDYLNSAADQRIDSSKPFKGTCPICRKAITRADRSGPKRSLIPLQLKLVTKKRSVPPTEA